MWSGLRCTVRLRALLLSLLLFPSLVRAQTPIQKDKIFFRNGDISSGSLQMVAGDSVTFKGNLTGTVDYKWVDIDHIDVLPHRVDFPVDSKLTGKKVLGEIPYSLSLIAGTLHLDPLKADTDIEPQSLPLPKIASVPNFARPAVAPAAAAAAPAPAAAPPATPPAQPTVSPWSGYLSSQDSVTRATQSNYQLGGSFHAARETQGQTAWKHQQLSLDAQASFSEASKPGASPVRTALYKGAIQNDFFLNDSELKQNFPNTYDTYYLFPFAEWYHNLSLGIDFQQSYGAGFGWQRLVKNKPNLRGEQLMQKFGFNVDLRYSKQHLYAPGSTYNLAAAGLSENYSVNIPVRNPKPFVFYERISIIPAFNVTRALETRGEAGFNVPLTCKLSIGPKVIDDYFRNAPHTSKQNYLQPSLSVTYSFSALPPATANRCNASR